VPVAGAALDFKVIGQRVQVINRRYRSCAVFVLKILGSSDTLCKMCSILKEKGITLRSCVLNIVIGCSSMK
jgi:hypothetical protein